MVYGHILWTLVCVRVWECVYLHAHFSVSWRSVWVLKAIWLSDMNLHFPFLLLINVFQPDVLCGYTNSAAADSRLHSNRFNTHFIDVLVLIQTGIASMKLDWMLSKPQPQTLETSFYLKYAPEKNQTNQGENAIGSARGYSICRNNHDGPLNTHRATTSL